MDAAPHKRLPPDWETSAVERRAYDGETVAVLQPPPSGASDVRNQFNTLRAVVSVARRVHDTRLLPPHSRTLNYSFLKRLLEATALYSNKTVKDYYAQYKQSDVVVDDLQHVADRALRDAKKDVREYVDRLLSPKEFLETEIPGGQFTAAFNACLDYVTSLADKGHPLVQRVAKEKVDATFKWQPDAIADAIVRHADFRGNIEDGSSLDSLLDRYNWYNGAQHAGGREGISAALQQLLTDALNKEPEGTREPLTAFDIALLGGLHPRTYAVEKFARHARSAEKKWAAWEKKPGAASEWEPRKEAGKRLELRGRHFETYDADVFFENCMAYFDSREDRAEDLGHVMYRTPLGATSKHTSYLRFREPLPAPPPPPVGPAAELDAKLSETLDFAAAAEKAARVAFLEASNASRAALHAWAASLKAIRDDEGTSEVKQAARENFKKVAAVAKEADGGLSSAGQIAHATQRAFAELKTGPPGPQNLEAAARSAQSAALEATSEAVRAEAAVAPAARARAALEALAAPRTEAPPRAGPPEPGQAERFRFGAQPAPAARVIKPDPPQQQAEYKDVGRIISKRARDEIDLVDTMVDKPHLERYCDACFEKGVEMYIRLVHTMIEHDLQTLRKWDPPTDDESVFVKAFAKLIGLVVQRAELANPRIQFANTAAGRDARRMNARGITQAKTSLALVFGVQPDVELCGYSMDGSFK